jgi:hypothetical protein
MGFGLVIRFIEPLQLVTTNKDYIVTVLHTSQITIGHVRSSQSVTVFTSHCLVAASNSRCSSSSGFPNCPWPQLPASHSKQLNPSVYLTNSPTDVTTDSQSVCLDVEHLLVLMLLFDNYCCVLSSCDERFGPHH